ncbi:venom allergen 5-like [Anopheles aquasalis]|uniref:venom allergen 5-like n=1 Tax=Anopheles aquasalis TaxID=42839 RepID=UPI00215AF84A|nr:venom allergen 5-like [Anopheles aquasalis]
MKVFIPFLAIIVVTLAQYRWTIFEQEHVNLCADSGPCGGGRPHTMCLEPNVTHARCQKFQPMVLSEVNIKSFMMGHNGLRNKVATNARFPAVDMQFLHWDSFLQAMAERWVRQCLLSYDECDSIGNPPHSVGQNIFFHPKPPLKHWEALVLSTWFNEKQNLHPTLANGELRSERFTNYTQLIWAKSEFVGCGAAQMYGGHLVVCYYHPKGNIPGQPVYRVGHRPCTGCPQERSSCSHVFRGLCGIDDRHSASTRPSTGAWSPLVTLLIATASRYANAATTY